jgi:hypothetical protein
MGDARPQALIWPRRLFWSLAGGLVIAAMTAYFLIDSSPVSATACSVRKDPSGGFVATATIGNRSWKPIRRVGVLIGATGINGSQGSLVQYNFDYPFAPFTTRRRIDSTEYVGASDSSSANSYMGSINECWARWADFADGSVWSVSPI